MSDECRDGYIRLVRSERGAGYGWVARKEG